LTSAQYTADFNEVKLMGNLSSTTRTADQTLAAFFWDSSTVVYFWDSVAGSLGRRQHTSLSDNARLLALLNVTMADAAISCWDAKYTYEFWRPITAIQLAAEDGNPATSPDPNWAPLFATGTPGVSIRPFVRQRSCREASERVFRRQYSIHR
jgi:hypothetical protein